MPTRYAEPALSVLSGLLAEPVAGWSGLLGGGADAVERTRDALTYQPRTKEGRQGMDALSGFLSSAKRKLVDENPPVKAGLDGYSALADKIGEYSPALGAAARTAPAAVGLLAGPGTSATRSAFSNVARDAVKNAGAVPAVRGPLAKQQGIFAGHLSKEAPIWKLEQAKTLQAQGMPDEDIYKRTGWFAGSADGQWRYEIDDSKSYYDPEAVSELKEMASDEGRAFDPLKETTPLGGLLGHDELYAAYPDAADMPVHFFPKDRMRGANGAYSVKHDRLTLQDDLNADKGRSVALHELQHAVQQREGFAQGGSPEQFDVDRAKYAADMQRLMGRNALDEASKELGGWPTNQEVQQWYKNFMDEDLPEWAVQDARQMTYDDLRSKVDSWHDLFGTIPEKADSDQTYRRLAGEAEARLVQKRMNMTPEQRAARYPLLDLDIPVKEQIVRRR